MKVRRAGCRFIAFRIAATAIMIATAGACATAEPSFFAPPAKEPRPEPPFDARSPASRRHEPSRDESRAPSDEVDQSAASRFPEAGRFARPSEEQLRRLYEHYRLGGDAGSGGRVRYDFEGELRETRYAREYAADLVRQAVSPSYPSVVRVRMRSERSNTNFHAQAVLVLVYRFGPAEQLKVSEPVFGAWHLSRVSSLDAALNSLRAIETAAVRGALERLDRRVAETLQSEGLGYHVRTDSTPDAQALRNVIAAVAEPISGEQWRFYDPPDEIQRLVNELLAGTGYRAEVVPPRATVRFVYNDEQ